MPPALSRAQMSALVMTKEERAAVQKDFETLSGKPLLAKKASCRTFMKANPDSLSASLPPGELLMRFHAHVTRCNKTQKQYQSEHVKTVEHLLFKELHWMSEEEMGLKFGVKKTAHWITSEALPERPDRVTGSMERYFKEFGCANDIEKLVESDFRRIKQQVTVEMEYEDMASWDMICCAKGFKAFGGFLNHRPEAVADSGAQSSEAKSPEEEFVEKVQLLKSTITETIMKYQSQSTTLKVVRTRAEDAPDADMIANFKQALTACISRTTRLVAMCEKVLQMQSNEEAMPKLFRLMKQVDERYDQMMSWATRFDLNGGVSAKKQKKSRLESR